MILGYDIFYVPHMVDRRQVRFPKSRRRRIRKKWRRQERNWRSTPKMELLVDETAGAIYGHPAAIEALRRAAREKGAGRT